MRAYGLVIALIVGALVAFAATFLLTISYMPLPTTRDARCQTLPWTSH